MFISPILMLVLGGVLLFGEAFAENNTLQNRQEKAVQSSSLSSSEKIIQQEIERRREAAERIEETLELADRLYQSGEWDHAQSKFELVLLGTQSGGQTDRYYQRARIGKSRCLAAKALDKEEKGNLQEAVGLIRQAQELDPDNKALAKRAESMQEGNARANNPFPGNPAASDLLVERVIKHKKLVAQSDQLAETGQYEKARKRLDEVRAEDPYNRVVLKKIELLEEKRIRVANKRYAASREKALAQVAETWFPPPPAVVPSKDSSSSTAKTSTAGEILKKLAEIRIPELTFNEKPIRDAVQELQRLSELYDPDKKGLNFVLRLPPPGPNGDPESATVSFELRDITLQTALKYLCEQVRGGEKLRPEVEDSAIFLLPATESGVDLENRTFALPPSVIAGLPKEAGTIERDDPKKLGENILKNIGVNTSMEGSSAVCFRDTGKLVVRNTPNELNKIEQRIRDAQGEKPQKQFEVETKLLQFSENDVRNLTFNLQMQMYQNNQIPGSGSYTPGAPGALYTPYSTGGTDGLRGTSGLNQNGASIVALSSLLDPTFPQLASNQVGVNAQVLGRGFSAFVQLLQNAIGKDLVAAPRVTLADGKESKIVIAREMFYPESYTQPTVPNNDQGLGAGFILPSTPQNFLSKNVGVTLTVKGESTSVPKAVDLDFTQLEVADFTGFVDYGVNIATVSLGAYDAATDTILQMPVQVPGGTAPYLVPIFSKRSLQSRVRLMDGETVGLGGLISETTQTVDDKVPGLGDLPMVGRLFRSKASQKIKLNLVIFCTLRIVEPDGSLSFPEDEDNPGFAQAGSSAMTPSVP